MIELKKLESETEEQFLWRIGQLVDSGQVANWSSINDIVNAELGIEEEKWRDESAFRKKYQAAKKFYDGCFSKMKDDTYANEVSAMKRELERAKIQFRDERNAWQKQNYRDARIDAKLDLLEEKLSEIGKVEFNVDIPLNVNSDNDLLVILSDLHIGQTFSSAWGKYDSHIAKLRLQEYLNEIIKIKNRHNSENIYVSIQGDLISGSIHKSIAITNRENVIEQIKLASELIASFCHELSHHFNKVFISNVSGNHSRIDKKDDALHDERLDDLIGWAVEMLLHHVDNIVMLHRNLDIGISDLNIRGKNYIAVHGDYDSFNKSGVANLVLLLGFAPYAITFGHLHTCAVDECNGIKMIRGGSLAGSGDSYTVEKRLSGKPSQMVCVCSNNGVEAYYPVILN